LEFVLLTPPVAAVFAPVPTSLRTVPDVFASISVVLAAVPTILDTVSTTTLIGGIAHILTAVPTILPTVPHALVAVDAVLATIQPILHAVGSDGPKVVVSRSRGGDAAKYSENDDSVSHGILQRWVSPSGPGPFDLLTVD
jgi:hypothetical protein